MIAIVLMTRGCLLAVLPTQMGLMEVPADHSASVSLVWSMCPIKVPRHQTCSLVFIKQEHLPLSHNHVLICCIDCCFLSLNSCVCCSVKTLLLFVDIQQCPQIKPCRKLGMLQRKVGWNFSGCWSPFPVWPREGVTSVHTDFPSLLEAWVLFLAPFSMFPTRGAFSWFFLSG